MFRDTVRIFEYYQGVGTRMVQRSHTAMESSTQLVGDCMPGLLRMMMMMVLEMRVITARMGITIPSRGNTNCIGPWDLDVSNV